ncbi:MAG: C40 family peptidase [Clostridium sp.]|nr:C40 family peptidase [Clostridium sp.]
MRHSIKIIATLFASTMTYILATAEEPADSITTTPDSTRIVSAGLWAAPLLAPENLPDTEDEPDQTDLAALTDAMTDFASSFLGARYRLGATGPKAFDCSGFMGHIYGNFGMDLNRTSRAQYTQGEKVDLKDVKPGDLLFFSGRKVSKSVGHVAMVTSVDPETGDMEFIHASSSKGIAYQKFPDNGYFSRRFLGARRIIGTDGFTPTLPTT